MPRASSPLRTRTQRFVVAGALLAIGGALVAQGPTYPWEIPASFPKPAVPANNPMSLAKVELGRRLFYDTRMSVDSSQSCATCHVQSLAFTDGLPRSVGATGEAHPRGSMSLGNVGYNPALTWANPGSQSLEDQALVPMLGNEPIELGLRGHEARFLRDVARDSVYQRLFPRAFPGDTAMYTTTNVVRAIAAFERTMISLTSPYDRYRYGGDSTAISESAKRGESFFFSGQRGGCFQCHGGWNFNGNVRFEGRQTVFVQYFNTGLYNIAGALSYPANNTGIHRVTQLPQDVGKFRAPTLRNIAITAPYMHDGSIATLNEVLDHYSAGGRTISSGPYAGVGSANPNKAVTLRGFPMTPQDRQDLIAFLESLTDSAFLKNPALSDPWKPHTPRSDPKRDAPAPVSRKAPRSH